MPIGVDSTDLPKFCDLGAERVSPGSGKKFYKPLCNDGIKPCVGMVFDSIQSAFVFYQKYALSCGFSVRKTTEYKHHGQVKLKYLVCSKEGFKHGVGFDSLLTDVKGKVKRRKPSKRIGCQAHVKLQLTDENKYKLYFFEEEHNHTFVQQEDVMFLTASRGVGFVKETEIHALSTMNLGPVRAFNILKSLCGGYLEIGATKSDYKNYKRDFNEYIGEYDAEMVIQRLTKKKEHLPNFSFEYTVKEDGTLGSLFWADAVGKQNYAFFGDVVGFDATYRSNKYEMVFVPFTGIDNHNRNVTLGAALLGCETADSYRWLLRSYIKAFGFAPKVVVTDQDAAMKRAIIDVFPNSRHRLCMWHIWEKLTAKVGTQLCATTDFKSKLAQIVWTDSILPDEFESRWHSILDEFGLTNHIWLKDMFSIREDWIPAYYRNEDLSGLMRTTSRSESENHFFGQFCNPRSTLVEFFSHFDTAIDTQRYEHRKNDHETRYTQPDILSTFVLEEEASKIFTRTIFLDQQLEIKEGINSCASVSVESEGTVAKFDVKDFLQPCSSFFKVIFCKEDLTISCSCRRFEQFGLLCRHAFYVLRLCDIREFPTKYVLKRWTREVVPNTSYQSTVSSEQSGTDWVDVEATVREIKSSTEYVINRLVGDKDQLCLFRDYVKSYMSKADEVEVAAPPPTRRDRFASLTGMSVPCNATIRVPIRSRTKGCGNQNRIKSAKEISINKASKGVKQCGFCKQIGHNQRTCALYIKSLQEKEEKTNSCKGKESCSSSVVLES